MVQSVQWLYYGLGNRASILGRSNEGIHLFATAFRQALRPPIVLSSGYRELFSEDKTTWT